MEKDNNKTRALFIAPVIFILLLILLLAIQNHSAMSDHKNGYKYLIGLSLPNSTTPRNIRLINEVRRQKPDSRDINIIIKEARDDIGQQTEDINELLSCGIDLLIIHPLHHETLKQKLNELDIPLIVLHEKKLSEKGTAFIRYDNIKTEKILTGHPDMYETMTDTALLILNNKTYDKEIILKADSVNKTEMAK